MSDYLSDLSGEIKKGRITAREDFADDIMKKIDLQRRGGLSSLPVTSRVIVIGVAIAIYSSLGVLLGVQGYRTFAPGDSDGKKNALVELMQTHHLSPDSMQDQIFSHFNQTK